MQRPSSSWGVISVATLCLLLFSFLTHPAYSFVPTDNILLDCGATSDGSDADKRTWTKDSGSPYAPPISDSSSLGQAAGANSDPNLPSKVPYGSARVMTSSASYKFNLSNGRHFVRLYFYPSSYINMDSNSAVFSVTSGPYTLLSNFSPSINALALSQAYIIREFFITVSGGSLQLTFTPSSNTTNSYAFINGIEIISSPEFFGSDPSNSSLLVGSGSTQYPVAASFALQTIARLNVGGNYISPVLDSNLSRIWYEDLPYIYGAGFGVSYSKDDNVTIRYPPAVPDYIAPVGVYSTARSMGPNVSVNLAYNLTWLITVDNGFTYLLRLHFCEIQSEISKQNQRVFTVSVNNQTAQSQVDVISYASQEITSGSPTGVPVYRDYAITLPPGNGGRSVLWIALYPNMELKPQYADAILNGLEVFKVNDSSGNLAGPNPTLPPPPPPSPPIGNSPKAKSAGARGPVIGGVVGGVAVVLAGLGICLCLCRRGRKDEAGHGGAAGWLPLSLYSPTENGKSTTITTSSTSSGKTGTTGSYASSLPSNLCRHFTISEIKAATNDFDESLLLGVGGFGKVYKGDIGNGTKVAIKRGNPLSEQGVHEFQNEIEMLSKLRHRHLVSLIGYCEDNCEMILVYDYMANGTLREHLYKTKKPPLSWRQRLEICIGAARGLHYLHTGAKYTIIHRDVKTTNILLDEKWVAKVSDFGLSKTGPAMDHTHVSTVVKGSFGYLDPEYYRRQQLTDKSDVYSFGVVLFEVLCGRPALNPSLPKEQVTLAEWAVECQRKGILEQIIDPLLRGKISPNCFRKFAETAEKCLADSGTDRPAMGDVLWNLEFALRLQDAAEEANEKGADSVFIGEGNEEMPLAAGKYVDSTGGFDGLTDTQTTGISLGDSSVASGDLERMTTPSAVFSQLVNPKGR
ncbi:receptor-like protein kinase FERONIA [Nymphaea colorata]|uniref:receptor-like protein kinase FERONIA n=1 Tax=Nymphaea colorata TaxID=210225 RepID=UPI00129E7696|nr:receptor-like protein kinase FERONIA [Nymphaea colorata]XP_049935970.1 receptor-like protein kinase FERONIA [Nymphaea colorata]